MHALPAVPHNVAGDSNDGHRSQLIVVDDWHALLVDVTPPHGERLTDADARAVHERHDVRKVPPSSTGLRTRLVLVLGGALCIHSRKCRRSGVVKRPRLARAGLDLTDYESVNSLGRSRRPGLQEHGRRDKRLDVTA